MDKTEIMNAIVIGLGSMGKRRIRLLHDYDPSVEIVGIDTNNERRLEVGREYSIKTFSSIDEAMNIVDEIGMAFVSTSPLSHGAIIADCLKRNLHTFTEINLSDRDYEDNMVLAKEKGLTLFLSSTFMYRREVEYIKKAVKESRAGIVYYYHVGQYLPDWHPWESYKDFFVGQKETNGCRELMAIEFPWLFDVFGLPKEWSVQSDRKSALCIDYPDTYQISIKHTSGAMGLLQVDIVSRKAVRNFECSAEDLYLTWDGTPDGLVKYDIENKVEVPVRVYDSVNKRSEYSASIIEDAYLNEIVNFISCINGKETPRYSFEKDKEILSIIDSIEGNL